jgi:hypothetical protein
VQVCVIVDEEGTEAAAVTAVVMMRATAVMAATPLIRCAMQAVMNVLVLEGRPKETDACKQRKHINSPLHMQLQAV